MDHLERTRLNAADHLGNAINTFITCDDRKVRRSIIFDAVDAIAHHVILRLATDPQLTSLRTQLLHQLLAIGDERITIAHHQQPDKPDAA